MGERLATDIFNFAGTELHITRRDLAGPGSDDDESDDEFVDPYFFDEGYTVAATTGFCRVWEAAEVLTRLLESEVNTMSGDVDDDAGAGADDDDGEGEGEEKEKEKEGGDARSLRERLRGRRVVELGSGVGLCGIAAAAGLSIHTKK